VAGLRTVNVYAAEVEHDSDDPDGYHTGFTRLGPQLGAAKLGASVYDMLPGQSICPYHYEYGNEEWLLVVTGRPTLRVPDGESELAPGDVVCFPEGPDGAHKVTNRTEEPVRVVILSTKHDPSIAIYPDSEKIGAWTGNDRDRIMARLGSDLAYYDGEL
jgi:uncharacterized cupin superfamily protein